MTGEAASIAAKDRRSGILDWVPGWIQARYGESRTRDRYVQVWAVLCAWFKVAQITAVADITRQHCFDYLVYRSSVSRSTAMMELRVLSVVLQESVYRGLIGANPATRLKLKAPPPAVPRPDIPDAMLDAIALAIENDKCKRQEFYRISFAIARFQGCRLNETRLPLEWVDFTTNVIRFRVKGEKFHHAPLHPKLRPLLLDLVNRGYQWTFAEPDYVNLMSNLWGNFLKRHGFKAQLAGLTFHCHRNTLATKFALANISEAKAMRYMAHSSKLVHRQYQRVRLDDLRSCCDALH